ncbi:putative RNA polymerase sigma factor FecI [compost metagenome]
MHTASSSDSLTRLYSDHHGWLKGWLRKKTGCPHNAADLAHDTYMRVIETRNAVVMDTPRAFLTTIAKRVLASYFRHLEVERAYLDSIAGLPEPLLPSPETQAIVIETLLEIDRILDGLPAKVRTAFLWAQIDGMPYAEIAKRLGVSLSSVKQYMARAIRQIYFPDARG